MKKLMTLLCTVICLLSFSACGAPKETVESGIDSLQVEEIAKQQFEMFQSIPVEDMQKLVDGKNSAINQDVDVALTYKRALSAWIDAQDDLGDFVSIDGCDVSQAEESVTAVLHTTYAQRKMNFTITFDSEMTKPISIKVEPEFTFGEKIGKAGLNTLMGMGTVFIVLIFIAFMISLFKYISVFEKHMADKKLAKEQKDAFVPNSAEGTSVVDVPEVTDEADQLELIAVITAAIAASENTSVDQLVVRSIKKRNTKR